MEFQSYKFLTKIQLLRWADVYGLKVYSSILGSAFRTEAHKQRGDRKDALFVYNFKKWNKNADEVRLAVETVAAHFDCVDIVAVPSSSTETNNLQRLFGERIKRVRAVPTRKNNHRKPLPDDYGESYVIDKAAITGNRLLVVDDVCATGTTLAHFAKRLESEGYEVTKLALGIDYKLDTQPAELIFVVLKQEVEPKQKRRDVTGMSDIGDPETTEFDALLVKFAKDLGGDYGFRENTDRPIL